MNKVDTAVAENEFQRFIDTNDIDADISVMSTEELADFNKLKRTIILRIEDGSLTLDADGIFTYTPRRSDDTTPIVFYEPKGTALIAMDRRKKGEDVAKMYATMGDLCRIDAKKFSLMSSADVKVCMAITTLFLA